MKVRLKHCTPIKAPRKSHGSVSIPSKSNGSPMEVKWEIGVSWKPHRMVHGIPMEKFHGDPMGVPH